MFLFGKDFLLTHQASALIAAATSAGTRGHHRTLIHLILLPCQQGPDRTSWDIIQRRTRKENRDREEPEPAGHDRCFTLAKFPTRDGLPA